MNPLVKLSLVAGVAGAGLVVLWLVSGTERRTQAEAKVFPPANRASSTPKHRTTQEGTPFRSRVTEANEVTALSSPSRDSEVASPTIFSTPLTPLEQSLCSVADTFLTEQPDMVGLLSLSTSLATVASLVPGSLKVAESTSSWSGKLNLCGNLNGTFSVEGEKCSIELEAWDPSVQLRRSLKLSFSEAAGTVRAAQLTVESLPKYEKAVRNNLGGTELVGWRVNVDQLDGTKLQETRTIVEDPAPSSPNYLLETRDVRDVEPIMMPWITDTSSCDLWLERLRSFRGQ